MLKESSNNHNKNKFSKTTNIAKEKMIAKTDSAHYQIKKRS